MRFVGTCIDCFDDDGDCLVGDLGWSDVSAFACAEEDASIVEVSDRSGVPEGVQAATQGHDCVWLESDCGVLMLYDKDEDIHYFFVEYEQALKLDSLSNSLKR